MKLYVTADIHSYYSPLREALAAAGYYEDKGPHKLVILGDLFDRGHEAAEVQAFVLDLMERDEIILIKGNHEDLFVEFATTDHGISYSHHVSNGTFDTALQLTGIDKTMATIRNYDFADAMKETPYFKIIIPAMKDYYETKRFIFVHGWIPCIRERNKQYSYVTAWRDSDSREWMAARWINGMKAANDGVIEPGKTIVCGHWHTSYGHSVLNHTCSEFGPDANFNPYYGTGIIALDACTAHSGIVNVITVEDE